MKTITTRTYNAIAIDHINKKIEVSHAFLNKASKMGTKEYNALVKAMAQHPTYEIAEKVCEKKAYTKFTIDAMRTLIKSQPNADEMLAEFEKVLVVAEALHAKYPRAKQWMFQNYGEIIKNNYVEPSEEETAEEVRLAAK